MKTIAIDELSLIAGTQVRTIRDTPTELMYQEVMTEAGTNTMFPPIIVYRDSDGSLWIADGHHRVAASIGAGLTTIVAEIREGTKSEAIKAAVVANRLNGVPLTRDDRYKAMRLILETSPELTDGALAELLGVARTTVMRWREYTTCANAHVEKRTGKDGKTRKAKQNKKTPCSPVSPTAAQPPQPTTSSRGSQPAQTCAELDETELDDALPERIDSMWRKLAELLTPFQNLLNECRSIYGDCGYQERIHELFDI